MRWGYRIEQDLAWIEGTVWFYDSFYRAQTKKRTGKEFGEDGKLCASIPPTASSTPATPRTRSTP
jgi:hypothetical protein